MSAEHSSPPTSTLEERYENKRYSTEENNVSDCNQDAKEGGASKMSDYMKLRAQNIQRHNARLRELGLLSEAQEKKSNAAAWGRGGINQDGDPSLKKKEKRKWSTDPPPASRRKSTRLLRSNSEPVGKSIENVVDADLEIKKEREEQRRIQSIREQRLRRAEGSTENEQNSSKNRTVTYEHCLMRIRSMTEKALLNRVKAIERAAGKNCVKKMAIFKSCLQDEGLWDLAKTAGDALERLKALEPPPAASRGIDL